MLINLIMFLCSYYYKKNNTKNVMSIKGKISKHPCRLLYTENEDTYYLMDDLLDSI